MNYYSLAYWLVVSTFIGVPLIVSLYILVTPVHKLAFTWQNFRISWTSRALKDRHFKHLPRKIRLIKVLSLVVFIACLWRLLAALQVDIFALL